MPKAGNEIQADPSAEYLEPPSAGMTDRNFSIKRFMPSEDSLPATLFTPLCLLAAQDSCPVDPCSLSSLRLQAIRNSGYLNRDA